MLTSLPKATTIPPCQLAQRGNTFLPPLRKKGGSSKKSLSLQDKYGG
jgi:hypothetical protein